MKPDAPTSGSSGASGGTGKAGAQSASRLDSSEKLTDGPILDLKAKRVPEPAQPKSAGPSGASTASGPTPKVGAAASPAADGSGAGFGTIAASGLLGGVIGAGLLFGVLQIAGSGGGDARLAALDQKIATLAPRDALGTLDKRVASNEQAVKAATDRANEALQKVSGQSAPATGEGAAPSGQADLVARLDALDQRVSALQEEPGREQPAGSKLTAPPAPGDAQQLAGLEERLKALESKASNASGGTPDIVQKLAALQGDVKASDVAAKSLGERLDKFQQSVDARVKSATEAVQSVTEASRKAAEAEKARDEETARGVGQKLQEQGDRLAALDRAVDGSAKTATVQAALRIVAADRIATALAIGAPYTDALSSLRSTEGGDAGKLAALAPYAESGAPTAASLATAFRPIREKILTAERTAKAKSLAETGSITDRLQAMASSIVQVRPSNSVPPDGSKPAGSNDDPTAAVQDALDRGRIVAAQQAFAALKDDLRAQGGDFGKTLKARADAEAAAQSLQAEAFKSLSAPTGSAPVR